MYDVVLGSFFSEVTLRHTCTWSKSQGGSFSARGGGQKFSRILPKSAKNRKNSEKFGQNR